MIQTMIEDGQLVILLPDKMDSFNAHETGEEIRSAIHSAPELPWLLDARNLEYISSAGLRLLLSLKKEAQGEVNVRNASLHIYETFSLTGFTELLNVKKRLRSVSIEDCPVVGRGAIGTVYRLDEDTIVKVYDLPDCLPMIEKERARARQAFICGIPTAIAYDIVKVGDRYGSVYEMVKAENCNDAIVRDPGRVDEVVQLYVSLLKKVHAVEMLPGELPDAREIYAGYLDELAGCLPDGIIHRIRELIAEMPRDMHVVHGDIQMKNVMLSDQEPLLVDMETLCAGNPVFDFAGLWMAYCAFNEDEPENSQRFLGIDCEMCEAIYRKVVSSYFGDDPSLQQKEERIQVLGVVRFLYLVAVMRLGKPELLEIRIRHALERLEGLLDNARALAI